MNESWEHRKREKCLDSLYINATDIQLRAQSSTYDVSQKMISQMISNKNVGSSKNVCKNCHLLEIISK